MAMHSMGRAGLPRARRNLPIGLWAGQRLGLADGPLAACCRDVTASDYEEPGDGNVLRKIAADLSRHAPAELYAALITAGPRACAQTVHQA